MTGLKRRAAAFMQIFGNPDEQFAENYAAARHFVFSKGFDEIPSIYPESYDEDSARITLNRFLLTTEKFLLGGNLNFTDFNTIKTSVDSTSNLLGECYTFMVMHNRHDESLKNLSAVFAGAAQICKVIEKNLDVFVAPQILEAIEANVQIHGRSIPVGAAITMSGAQLGRLRQLCGQKYQELNNPTATTQPPVLNF